MYSLDVNFLKDRNIVAEPTKKGGRSSKPQSLADLMPLIAGIAVGLILPAAVGGLWLYAQNQNTDLEAKIAKAEEDIKRLDIELAKGNKINQEADAIKAEVRALASVFSQIKPWSAMLQDLRDRVPQGVQIKTIQQTEVAPIATNVAATAPAAGNQKPALPRPTNTLEIAGTARSFKEVNNFLLLLQQSAFLKPNETQLVSANLIKNPTQVEVPAPEAQRLGTLTVELPDLVEYRIKTSLSDVSSTDARFLRELESKGDIGLVTRIRTLQRGGIKQ